MITLKITVGNYLSNEMMNKKKPVNNQLNNEIILQLE
jgi:hypothetical protein